MGVAGSDLKSPHGPTSAITGCRAGDYGLGILDARIGEAGQIKPLPFDQEDVIAYEIGYKGTLADGTLQLNALIYTYDYENYQDQIDVIDPFWTRYRTAGEPT